MKVLIYGNLFIENSIDYIETLLIKLESINTEFKVFKPFYESWQSHINSFVGEIKTFNSPDDVDDDTDFMISLGGDGTFLESVLYVRDKNIPIIGINMGRLGFLANITQEDIAHSIDEIFKKNYTIEERSLIHFKGFEDLFGGFPYALNDVTIQKKNTSMITIHTYLNDELLNSYWADGLIISTSTGSTAYSLSVGGPIVLPSARDFVICPIAPHNLSIRPIITPEEYEIKLKIESRSETFLATVDNRSEVLDVSSDIILEAASFRIKLLHIKNYNFYNTIRNKLMWGIDKRN